jgi:hypothetical protein
MKYLGNIVTQNKIETTEFINITDNIENVDKNIPTLIIGYNNYIKNVYPEDKISVIDRYIDENTVWTFSKYEKANDYEKDIIEFQQNLFDELDILTNYEFFNRLTSNLSEIKEFVKILTNIERKHVYIYENQFVYISIGNNVYGFSLEDIEYTGISKEKVLKKIGSLLNIKVFDNNRFLTYKTQKFIMDKRYLTPILYKLKYN